MKFKELTFTLLSWLSQIKVDFRFSFQREEKTFQSGYLIFFKFTVNYLYPLKLKKKKKCLLELSLSCMVSFSCMCCIYELKQFLGVLGFIYSPSLSQHAPQPPQPRFGFGILKLMTSVITFSMEHLCSILSHQGMERWKICNFSYFSLSFVDISHFSIIFFFWERKQVQL